MITLKMAFRNVLRQKRRTLLTVMTMMGGFALSGISIAWSDGTYNNIIDMFTRNQMGHIQIHRTGYLDRPTLYNTINNSVEIGRALEQLEGVVAWSPRIYSAGLVSVGQKSSGVKINGIDPRMESKATRFEKKIIEGRTFSGLYAFEAILGKGLAAVLSADVGDEIVVLTQGADGSMANDLYEIVGIIESGDNLADQIGFYLPLGAAQELLVLNDRVHEMVIIGDHLDNIAALTDSISGLVNDSSIAVEPWQEFANQFYKAMQADREGMWVTLFIIILIVAVGVLNTVLMTVLERTREYGVLRAIGVRPFQVTRLVLYEVALMAILSVVIGSAFSFAANYYLSVHGFSLPEPIMYGGVEFSRMYSEINLRSFTIPAVTVVLSAVLVGVLPAIRAARTEPAKAMRTH